MWGHMGWWAQGPLLCPEKATVLVPTGHNRALLLVWFCLSFYQQMDQKKVESTLPHLSDLMINDLQRVG